MTARSVDPPERPDELRVMSGVPEFMTPSPGQGTSGPVLGTSLPAVIQLAVPPVSSHLRRARKTLRDQLDLDARADRVHVDAVQTVANELLGAAIQARVAQPVVLSVELFARLTSVRVHCASDVDLRDEPFGMRENMLQGLAFAWGKRNYADGSVDLWAEVARPGSALA